MTDLLPFSEFQKKVREVAEARRGRAKNCIRQAFVHLERAWAIRKIDPEMAIFRVITAEEEAASAIIHAVQLKGYPNAEKLKARDHVHKAALYAFLQAVRQKLPMIADLKPRVIVQPDAPHVAIQFEVNAILGLTEAEPPKYAQPVPPLNWVVSDDTKRVLDFTDKINEIAAGAGLAQVIDYLRQEANLRNRLLYASDDGIPTARAKDAFFLDRLSRVVWFTVAYLIIDEHPEHQLFVTQCIYGLVKVLSKVEPALGDLANIAESSGAPVNVRPDWSKVATYGWYVQVRVPKRRVE